MKKYNKTLFQIFFALILVAIIMFVSNYIVFRNSVSEIYNQFRANNNLVVKSTIKSFDEAFKEINNIIFTINMLPYEGYERENPSNLDAANAYIMQNNLSKLISRIGYIEEVVIFSARSDKCITSRGTTTLDNLFGQMYKNSKYAKEFWKNFAVTRHPIKLIPEAMYTELGLSNFSNEKKLLAIVGSNQLEMSKLNIIVFINTNILWNTVNQQSLMDGASFVVLDQDKNIIVNMGEQYDLENSAEIYFNSKKEITFKQGAYEYDCVRSDYNDFMYINKIPVKYKNTLTIVRENYLVMFFTIIISIALAVTLSYYLYRPIRNILNLISNKTNDKDENKFIQIYNTIKQFQRENESLKNELDFSMYDIRRSIFFKMTNEGISFESIRHQVDKHFKDIFACSSFAMIGIQLKENNNFKGDKTLRGFEELFALIRKIIGDEFKCSLVIHIQNMHFIALVGLEQGVKRASLVKTVEKVVADLSCDNLSNYYIFSQVSKQYIDARDCKQAFYEIKMCLNYMGINSDRVVTDAEKIQFLSEVYYPADFLDKLTNYINSGNSEACIENINEVIDKNVVNNVSIIKFSHIISSIFDCIIKGIKLNNYNTEDIANLELEFFKKLENSNNYQDLKAFFKKIIKQLTDKITVKNENKLNKEFIIQFINLHYSEDLYLEKMAEVMGTTPKYFSNYFKKAFGVNFIESLNKTRISHAKEYLKNTDIAINEIGQKVGYANSSTFTSTFKKFLGISPTEYRKEYRK
jgi:two-component system, response regulator YesN